MGKSQESFNKKEKEKKKLQKKREKENRKEERKSNSDKGKSFEDMLAYVDAYGNIVDSPPDPNSKIEILAENIQIGISREVEGEEEESSKLEGVVSFFNEGQGFGFIKQNNSQESYFVHVKDVEGGSLSQGDKVAFDVGEGPRGARAINVQKR
jgi:cold shock CspA family protein